MTNHLIGSEADVRRLALDGRRLVQVRVAEQYVDLVLSGDESVDAVLRIESGATVTAERESSFSSAGPVLGGRILGLLGGVVRGVSAQGLDLILAMEPGIILRVHVDRSGYESYSVLIGDDCWTAIRG